METNKREWWENAVMAILGVIGGVVAMVLMF